MREKGAFMKKKIVSLLLIVAMLTTIFTGCNSNNETKEENVTKEENGTKEETVDDGAAVVEEEEDLTLRLLVCWNGLSFLKPSDDEMNAVAQVIKEKTGVTLETEWVNTSENEVLNMLFASGDMPDMIMAPFWGGADPVTATIKSAANSELLLPLDDLIAEYGDNLVDAYQAGVAQSFRNEINDPNVGGGATFVLPMHTPATAEDMTNWGYTVFARGDILEALDVDPSSINTSQDVYELAVKIKDGGFTDIMGNPVIPASNWQHGWSYETFLNSFRTRTLSGWILDENGDVVSPTFTENYVKEALHMRKMISEGLYDVEAFNQDDNMAKTKHATGKVALTSAHYYHIKNNTKELVNEHPEMEYLPLGPIYDAEGKAAMPDTMRLSGNTGAAVMMLTSDCENPEAAVRYLNYINSEEGRMLAYLGIEGEHWSMVDGEPRMSDEFFAKKNEDPAYPINQGIGSIFTFGVSRLPNEMFAKANLEDINDIDETEKAVKSMYPIQLQEGLPLNSFQTAYPKYEELQINLESIGFNVTQAYFASSDEEALKLIEDYRNALISIGFLDYVEYMNEVYHTTEGVTP